jgi:hypothetical protein
VVERGLGFSLPPAKLARRDSARFREVKRLFSTAPEVEKWRQKSRVFITEKRQPDAGPDAVQGGPARPVSSSRGQRRNALRVCDRTLVWPDQRVRSVLLCAEEEHATGASGPSQNRRVRSGVQRGRAQRSADQTRDASNHVRLDVSGRSGSLLDSDWTRGAARPVKR